MARLRLWPRRTSRPFCEPAPSPPLPCFLDLALAPLPSRTLRLQHRLLPAGRRTECCVVAHGVPCKWCPGRASVVWAILLPSGLSFPSLLRTLPRSLALVSSSHSLLTSARIFTSSSPSLHDTLVLGFLPPSPFHYGHFLDVLFTLPKLLICFPAFPSHGHFLPADLFGTFMIRWTERNGGLRVRVWNGDGRGRRRRGRGDEYGRAPAICQCFNLPQTPPAHIREYTTRDGRLVARDHASSASYQRRPHRLLSDSPGITHPLRQHHHPRPSSPAPALALAYARIATSRDQPAYARRHHRSLQRTTEGHPCGCAAY
uniref:Uncharacterized protein n=1 Tax=Mycena chlorophos TaxID=658473 RepID=A0ABQ0LDK2_MYCCL|nr:predicted protein [Mycena chlorophos]